MKCSYASIIVLFVWQLCTAMIYGNLLEDIEYRRPLDRPLKILVLIIASDDLPVYLELQRIWRAYMHYDPAHVEAYFIKGNPDLSTECEIQGDVIWCRAAESITPGLMNKTFMALEAFLPRIKEEFDYVLRPNLSSFYVFPRLLAFLSKCSRTKLYAGMPGVYAVHNRPESSGISGAGIIFSSDLVELVVSNREYFVDNMEAPDDVLLSRFFYQQGIRAVPHGRLDLMPIERWHAMKNKIPQDIFQFRIKNEPHLRLSHDVYVHTQLLQMFYGVQL